jgi:hypothetical protein
MRAAPCYRFALCRRRRGSQFFDQFLRNAQDGEDSHRQQDVGNHRHRFSIRDKPVRSIGDRILAPACNLVLTTRSGKKLSAPGVEIVIANAFFTARRPELVCQKGIFGS